MEFTHLHCSQSFASARFPFSELFSSSFSQRAPKQLLWRRTWGHGIPGPLLHLYQPQKLPAHQVYYWILWYLSFSREKSRKTRWCFPSCTGIPEVLPGGSDSKESACNAGDLSSIPGSGRSPRERNGNPLQYSCLGNPKDRGPGALQSLGSQRVGHDWVNNTFTGTRG